MACQPQANSTPPHDIGSSHHLDGILLPNSKVLHVHRVTSLRKGVGVAIAIASGNNSGESKSGHIWVCRERGSKSHPMQFSIMFSARNGSNPSMGNGAGSMAAASPVVPLVSPLGNSPECLVAPSGTPKSKGNIRRSCCCLSFSGFL